MRQLSVTRSGGFAGLTKRAAVDLERLPAAALKLLAPLLEKERLRKLAAAAAKPPGPGGSGPGQSGADRFVYALKLTDESGDFEVRLPEAGLDKTIAACLHKVFEIAEGGLAKR
jgi:hypothetical protein